MNSPVKYLLSSLLVMVLITTMVSCDETKTEEAKTAEYKEQMVSEEKELKEKAAPRPFDGVTMETSLSDGTILMLPVKGTERDLMQLLTRPAVERNGMGPMRIPEIHYALDQIAVDSSEAYIIYNIAKIFKANANENNYFTI